MLFNLEQHDKLLPTSAGIDEIFGKKGAESVE
jgi:hypothetical protein